jgi:2-polyprenyl-6-methoxyphenol hydroxylase-like FAD-dependent oxidoreductase
VDPLSTAVIIVGAGPVGLALANELGYRGVPFAVIDDGDGGIPFPAGEALFSRTMEHLRRWGMAESVRHNPGFPDTFPMRIGFGTSLTGHLLATFDGPSNAEVPASASDNSPEGIAICPKFVFDPLLRRGAERFSFGMLRYHTRVTAVHDTVDGVTCDVVDLETNAQYTVAGRYLAACDGARSTIRRQLEIPYVGSFGQGHNFAVSFRAPALHGMMEERFGRRFFQFHTLNTPNRPYFTTVNGHDLWRMSMYIERDDDPAPEVALANAVGVPLDFEIARAQPWAGHRVVAQRYRTNNVFLLGDAAHLRWPKGGFGANTGIGDAVDLGWKIAAVLAGWGSPELLASYEAERRPIAIRNVNEAANNRVLDGLIAPDRSLDDESVDTLRRRADVGNAIHALRLREFRTQGIQLGYRYRNSPICIADGSLEPPDDHQVYSPSAWPGSRAPHAWLSDGRSTLDLFGRGFVLLRFAATAPFAGLADAAAASGVPFTDVPIDQPEIADLYERPLVLVRPDGHVAWRGDDDGDALAIVDRVRGATATAR